MFKTLEELIAIIRQRKGSSIEESYTKKLLSDKNLSVEKVKEEVRELIEEIDKEPNPFFYSKQVHEAADVIYHLMVYLEANNIMIEDVMEELKKRQKK
jgi:phosphoribosyl-ATP pyrophosphohydrolase|tara:strand:- start:63 stop:356 length:294 start_codon:yes stop_codon:yes gene_type:complete